jgi:hypothetical protein
MQSNGGLVAAAHFQGKDSVLSGPAGGLIGMAKVGQAAGFDKLIGFDMGGTSTDVSLFSGEFERSLDTRNCRSSHPRADARRAYRRRRRRLDPAASTASVCWPARNPPAACPARPATGAAAR